MEGPRQQPETKATWPSGRDASADPTDAAALQRRVRLSEYAEIRVMPPAEGSSRTSHWQDSLGERPLTQYELLATDNYRLGILAEDFHGQSSHFQCRPGSEVRVPISLYPNV